MTPKQIVKNTSDREIAAVFKTMLRMLEDMKHDHDFHYQKLYDEIPEEYHPIIRAADHFTNDKVQWIRKRILDCGNDSLRKMEEELENFTVSFIFNKKEKE